MPVAGVGRRQNARFMEEEALNPRLSAGGHLIPCECVPEDEGGMQGNNADHSWGKGQTRGKGQKVGPASRDHLWGDFPSRVKNEVEKEATGKAGSSRAVFVPVRTRMKVNGGRLVTGCAVQVAFGGER